MKFLGLEIPFTQVPELDPDFLPLEQFHRAFLSKAEKPIAISVERDGGVRTSFRTFLHGTPEKQAADHYYIERLLKTLLWMKGGYKIYIQDNTDACRHLRSLYCAGGQREFDWEYMSNIFEHPFEILEVTELPPDHDVPEAVGGHLNGCRIGFDAGGSDRKVSAVMDGTTVFSEEVVWFPKLQTDPAYHYGEIVSALKRAAAHLPRVDGVGISTAGIVLRNRVMVASLFLKVPKELFDAQGKDIYLRAVQDTFGEIPCRVANDGDVSALAGATCLKDNSVLGIAMGTSEAAGFVDEAGCVTGWLNELAFVPVDANPAAARDEWSGDIGCGVKYFSQDAVIRLASVAGLTLETEASPADKLKEVQFRMEVGDERAAAIYRSIGVYLAHTLALYHRLYHCRHVLLLGRVMSGAGGDLLLESCRAALTADYPELLSLIQISLPDEQFRRLGQSAVAASLPLI